MGLDYYGILNVPRNATPLEIKLAYRKYAIASHPKRKTYPFRPENPPEGISNENIYINHLPTLPMETIWNYVNEAYDILINPLTREVFDRYGEEGLKSGTMAPCGYIQPYVYHADYMKTFRDALGSDSPYTDLIDAVTHPPLLYTAENGKGVRFKDADIETPLYLTLSEIFWGALKKIQIFRDEFSDETFTKTERREKIFSVKTWPGILTGTRIRFPDEGDRGPTKFPADLVFIITELPDGKYKRYGADLHMNYEITLNQALCGFVIKLKTIDDRIVRIQIIDVVNPNYVKVIESEGLPFDGDCNQNDCCPKGNLFIHFNVEFPVHVSLEGKKKFTEIFNTKKYFEPLTAFNDNYYNTQKQIDNYKFN